MNEYRNQSLHVSNTNKQNKRFTDIPDEFYFLCDSWKDNGNWAGYQLRKKIGNSESTPVGFTFLYYHEGMNLVDKMNAKIGQVSN